MLCPSTEEDGGQGFGIVKRPYRSPEGENDLHRPAALAAVGKSTIPVENHDKIPSTRSKSPPTLQSVVKPLPLFFCFRDAWRP